MEFHFFREIPEKNTNASTSTATYAQIRALRNKEIGSEEEWRWDFWDWERCLDLEYDTEDFNYENGWYIHIIQRQDRKPFSVEDFRIIQEEILSTSSTIPILEVNITLFF